MAAHPTKDQLSDFLLGKLAPENGDKVGDHLESCPSCQQTISHLDKDGDTLMRNLRRPAAAAPADPALQKVMQKAANIVPGAKDAPAAAKSPSPKPATKPAAASGGNAQLPTTEATLAHLRAANVLSPDDWTSIEDDIANAVDGAALLKRLIERQLLTKYQGQQIYNGRLKGLVFGDFVVLDKLGAGGMGQVFRARHRRMDRIVALKVMSQVAMKDAEAVRRFMREAQAAARLIHPNIVTAFDAGEGDGIHFLAMEYVDGSDLAERAKKVGNCSVAQAADYILQAGRGLAFAHSKGVIHRDIKPANLLLDKDGTVKILDMGLARMDGPSGDKEGLTQSGQMMGTIDYIAPEQAINTRLADARSDVYSLGCTLYRLLTGESPYGGETMMEKLLAHREQPIPSLNTGRNDVPPMLESIYRKMMAKDPKDRYATMAEVVAELEQFCGGHKPSVMLPVARALPDDSIPGHEPTLVFENNPVTIAPKASGSKKTKSTLSAADNKKLIAMGMGGVLALLLLVAGIIVTLKTDDGTLIVEVDQPDATVQILDANGTVEITEKEEKGKITISVDPGKHRLKIEKDGFIVFGQDFEIGSGKKKTIKAKLERKPSSSAVASVPSSATVASKPVPSPPVVTPLPSSPAATAAAATLKDPAFQQWLNQVLPLPAAQKIDAVTLKMKELNPGFVNGKLVPLMVGNEIKELRVERGYALDISPLRAFPELDSLSYGSSSQQAEHRLVDISPLKGMKIARLAFGDVYISDLSPLEGMPLTSLTLPFSRVADLSPLRKTKLETLDISKTAVTDLSGLRGLQLTKLSAGHNQIADLSPLKGMPLKELSVSSTTIIDISPLRDMSLETLDVSATRVTDWSPLQGMPLTSLSLVRAIISDLSVLKGMKLKVLNCEGNQVSDLTPLLEMSTLTNLNLLRTKVNAADVAKLQAALPNCKILYDGPTSTTPPATPVTPSAALVTNPSSPMKPDANRPLADGELLVCSLLAPNQSPKNPASEVVAIRMPDGPPRGGRGANGVYVPPTRFDNSRGSEWTCTFSHDGWALGIQFVHPFKNGHVLVSVSDRAVLSVDGNWAEKGYSRPDSKLENRLASYASKLPLKKPSTQLVASRLAADGRYELLIDNELVMTATIANVAPFNMPELPIAANLPQIWPPGSAAIIVGPTDRGLNNAEDVRLGPALPIGTTGIASPSLVKAVGAGVAELIVCKTLQAKRKPTDVLPKAIPFDGSPSNGRSGANGIYLSPDLVSNYAGTEWSFGYARTQTAEGVQVVHPLGTGHVVVTFSHNGAALGFAGKWTGYRIVESKIEQRTPSYASIFKYETSTPRGIISRLAADGRYEMLVDEQPIMTATITSAEPFTVPDTCKGNGFPHTWPAGSAGILMGPLDGGINVANDVRLRSASSQKTVSGLVGRGTANGVDVGYTYTYQLGYNLTKEELKELSDRIGQNNGKLELTGILSLSSDAEVTIRHKGGSSSGGVNFFKIEGIFNSEVGDDRSKDDTKKIQLKKGNYPLRWQIVGGFLGGAFLDLSVVPTPENGNAVLNVFASPAIVDAARSSNICSYGTPTLGNGGGSGQQTDGAAKKALFRGKPFAQVKLENAVPPKPLRVGVVYSAKYVWKKIPDELKAMQFQSCFDVPTTDRAKLVFEVTKPGIVLMATTSRWGGGGNISPQIAAELTSRQQLLDQGWELVSELGDSSEINSDNYRFQVFARSAEAGEKFAVRTEKYVAPILIYPE